MSDEYVPLHLKYRPQSFKQIAGNLSTIRALEAMLAKKGRPHSLLFTGPRGCGKTTLARIVAKELGCSDRDFHEMNSAQYRGIESVREMISASVRRPWVGDVSVYALDECHQMTRDAQSALLKILEEPPRHAYFLLATTDPEKLLPTIRSRCATFAVQALSSRAVLERLMDICEREKLPDTHPTDATLKEIARLSQGSLRQALIMLDQVSELESEDEAREALLDALGDERSAIELCRALHKGREWSSIRLLIRDIDAEPETVRHTVLSFMNSVAMNETGASFERAMEVMEHFLPTMMYTGKAGLTMACYKASAGGKERSR